MVGSALLTPDITTWPNLAFLALVTLILIIAGTRAALALAIVCPLLADPVPALFLVSLLASAALAHETRWQLGHEKHHLSQLTSQKNLFLICIPIAGVLGLLTAVSLIDTTNAESLLLLAVCLLQSLIVLTTLLFASTRALNGSSTWWVGLVFAPLLVPLISQRFYPIVGWLALMGAAFALHLAARSMVIAGTALGVIVLTWAPTPSALLTGVLFLVLLATLLMPVAKTRGVIALKDPLPWQLVVVLAMAGWVGWSFWQAPPAMSISQNFALIFYVGFLFIVAFVNRGLLRLHPPLTNGLMSSVMLVIGQLGRGGAEKQLVLLANSLAWQGVQTTLVAFHGGERRSQIDSAVNVIVIQERPSEKLPWLITVTPRLWFIIWRYQPNVLIAFLLYAYLSSIPLSAISTNATRVSARRSLGMFKEIPWLLFVERLVNSVTNLVIANSQAVASHAIEQERLDPKKVKIVCNVLPQVWYPNSREASPARTVVKPATVLNVANLIAYKGQAALVEAIALVKEEFPETTLRIVGDGPEKATITNLAKKLNVDLVITGFSEVDSNTYLEGQLFVLSSTEEGMSNSLMEAMAAGKPIVATAVGGNPETLGEAGLLVAPGDPAALAKAITTLLANPALAKGFSEKASVRAKELFDSDGLGLTYIELIMANK